MTFNTAELPRLGWGAPVTPHRWLNLLCPVIVAILGSIKLLAGPALLLSALGSGHSIIYCLTTVCSFWPLSPEGFPHILMTKWSSPPSSHFMLCKGQCWKMCDLFSFTRNERQGKEFMWKSGKGTGLNVPRTKFKYSVWKYLIKTGRSEPNFRILTIPGKYIFAYVHFGEQLSPTTAVVHMPCRRTFSDMLLGRSF